MREEIKVRIMRGERKGEGIEEDTVGMIKKTGRRKEV